jgi:branched-chain amino acid transport system substrate-binding protein
MARSHRSVVLLLLVAQAAVLALGAACADELLIGVAGPMSVTPLTGRDAAFGEQLARGAEMAVRDINARGGVGG